MLASRSPGFGPFSEQLLPASPHEAGRRATVALLAALVVLLAAVTRARRLRSEGELAASQASYKALIENVEDGVVSLAPDGTVEFASHAAARLVGLQPPELVHRHFSLWIHPGDRDLAEAAFARALAGSPEVAELRLVGRDGRVRRVRSSSRPLVVGGELAGILAVVTDLSSRHETEEQLRQLSRAVEASSSAVVITDASGCITYVNPKFTEMTGYKAEEVQGRNPRLLKSGEVTPAAFEQMWQTISSGGEWRGEFHNRRKDGTVYWEFASISPVVDSTGTITHYVAVKEDITARKAVEAALAESEEKYRLLFSRQLDAAALVDEAAGRFVEVNEAFLRLFGWSEDEVAVRSSAEVWAAGAPPALPAGGATFPELWCRRSDGQLFPAEVAAGSFHLQGRAVSCYILRDITERIDRQRWLEALSATDPLTGLANRRAFNERLDSEWRRAVRSRTVLAVVMADLDHFKSFNDTCGHLAGDECLRRVAEAMLAVARRTSDLVARWGGEELAVLLPGTDTAGAATVAEVMRLAVERLAVPHPASPVASVVTASFGVASAMPGEGVAKESLLEAADAALYAAKREGRNRVVPWSDPGPSYGMEESAPLAG
ncbi:MAG TPA: PAS domain S-box protein [Thermoanaerobaculaceae bacterium]|nr:PAS domain S-box protein [Thermoanaerobaculaceae bacterium]HRS14732.1 PAS domain S-box protein [Thermoanaerobaculaceae bacterium]